MNKKILAAAIVVVILLLGYIAVRAIFKSSLICCNEDTDECTHVDFAAACPPDQILGSCEWGIQNSDGTVDCFD